MIVVLFHGYYEHASQFYPYCDHRDYLKRIKNKNELTWLLFRTPVLKFSWDLVCFRSTGRHTQVQSPYIFERTTECLYESMSRSVHHEGNKILLQKAKWMLNEVSTWYEHYTCKRGCLPMLLITSYLDSHSIRLQ